jgi:co-chaperonin GroES (HSP10)
MTFKAYADNVVIVLEPLPTETASGIAMVRTSAKGARESRTARVVASGPGYRTRLGALVPNELKEGDRVVVDALAGQNYALDLTIPRHNKNNEFQELFGERGEFRIIRQDEALAVLD